MCTGGIQVKGQGLEEKHVYTLIGTYEVKWNNQEVRLVQLRNPWGSGEWEGEWSDKDKEHWTPELNKELNHVDSDDGTFFMPFEKFTEFYNYTIVTRVRDDFVPSYIVSEKTSLIAAFRVPQKIKGCITVYQLTQRLAKSVGKDGKLDILTLELYKLDGEEIKSTGQKATSNGLWYSHIPIHLDPGTYVVHAYFPPSTSSYPYISLIVYAEQAVDIVKLEAETVAELKPKNVKVALMTIKNSYSIKKPPERLLCKFDKCLKAHDLVWNSEPTEKNVYHCDGCRTMENLSDKGRWSCKQCKYEICPKCRPKDIVTVDASSQAVKCFSGHDMKFEGIQKEGRLYLCCKCGKAYYGSIPRWTCGTCELDLCLACIAPPKDFKPIDVPCITKCPRAHTLVFMEEMTIDGSYKCAFCGRTGNPIKGRWYCASCNMNICLCCVPLKGKSASMKPESTSTTCTKGHLLEFTTVHKFGINGLGCDKCRKIIPLGTWRWNCPQCSYDVCIACRPAPKGRSDILCPRKHMVSFLNSTIGGTTFSRCGRCHKTFNVTKGRYRCNICNFDICITCEPFDKSKEETKSSPSTSPSAAPGAAPGAAPTSASAPAAKPGEEGPKFFPMSTMFEDKDFPRTPDTLVEKSSDVFWVPADEIFKGQKYFVYDKIEINDIVQGEIGDAYLMAPLASIAEFPNRVEKIIISKDVNPTRTFSVRLFVAGVPKIVEVDCLFPARSNGVPIYALPKNNQIWPLIIEKGWAKIHKGFKAIEGGDPREGFAALTGAPCELYMHEKISRKDMWETLLHSDRQNFIMCAAGAKEKLGLAANHCYSLVKVAQLEAGKGVFERLVQLRNPWGGFEWQGDWGDSSPRWTPAMKKRLSHEVGDDGTFFMKFEDFCYYFSYSFICKYYNNYRHSVLETEGKSACALMPVTSHCKAFLSVHQLSKRMGVMANPQNYRVGSVLFEVYRYSNSKLERVATQRSNTIGICNLEIILEPGIYVLFAKFDTFIATIPVLNFVAYAEKNLKLIKLKEESTDKIDLEELKKQAIETIPKEFPASILKRAGKGIFCSEGHPLVLVEKNENAKKVRCDSCMKIKDMTTGEWRCDKCKYDLCLECKKQSELILTKNNTTFKNCKKGHPLTAAISPNEAGIFVCECCGYFGELSRTARSGCTQGCTYNVCEKCKKVEEAIEKQKKEPDKVSAWTKCPMGHNLAFSTTLYYGDAYDCFACGKIGQCHYGRWNCQECGFDLCLNCKGPEKPLTEEEMKIRQPISLGIKYVCPKQHILHFSTLLLSDAEMFACLKCSKQWNRKDGRWYCSICNYEICSSCRPNLEDIPMTGPLCPNGHAMGKTEIGYADGTLFRCDACQKTFKTSIGRITCLCCGYDMCVNCVEPPPDKPLKLELKK